MTAVIHIPTAERIAMIYTPAVFDHLEALRHKYEEQRDEACKRLKECDTAQDEDGVKIAQVDLDLSMRSLSKVNEQIRKAQQELVCGSDEVQAIADRAWADNFYPQAKEIVRKIKADRSRERRPY